MAATLTESRLSGSGQPQPARDARGGIGRMSGRSSVRMLTIVGLMLGAALGATTAQADVNVVVLVNGERHVGQVTRSGKTVTVKLGDEETQFPANEVKEVLTLDSAREQFAAVRAKAGEDMDKLIDAANFAFDSGLTDEALEVADAILAIDANSTLARRIKSVAQARKRVIASMLKAPPKTADADAAATPASDDAKPAPKGDQAASTDEPAAETAKKAARVVAPLDPLSAADINRIRIREIYLGTEYDPDNVTVNFKNNALKRFIEAQSGKPGWQDRKDIAAFERRRPHEQLQVILRTVNDELESWEGDIEIRTDPPPMKMFNDVVVPFVAKNCATAACHGGETAPGFAWHRAARLQPGQLYANFLELEAAVYGDRGQRLVDRERPDESLLLHYINDPAKTEIRHPTVAGYPVEPFTRHAKARTDILRWIDLLRYPPKPDYGVKLMRAGKEDAPVVSTPREDAPDAAPAQEPPAQDPAPAEDEAPADPAE